MLLEQAAEQQQRAAWTRCRPARAAHAELRVGALVFVVH